MYPLFYFEGKLAWTHQSDNVEAIKNKSCI